METQQSDVIDERVIKLLRASIVSWNTMETGAAMIDSQMPYGSTDMIQDIKRITGVASEAEALALHRHTEQALGLFIQEATLEPGTYTYNNPHFGRSDPDADFENVKYRLPDLVASDKVTLKVTEQHLKLLYEASHFLRWEDEYLGDGEYPTVTFDPKRPYGAMSYFSIDMALTLGIAFQDNAELEQMDDYFYRLHWEMQPALQIFLKHAKLPSEKAN